MPITLVTILKLCLAQRALEQIERQTQFTFAARIDIAFQIQTCCDASGTDAGAVWALFEAHGAQLAKLVCSVNESEVAAHH
jgi:hypothetical protein